MSKSTKTKGAEPKEEKLQLTDEDRLKIPAIREKWIKNITAIRLDKEKAMVAVEMLYKLINLPMPEVVFTISPYAAVYKSWELRKKIDPNANLNDFAFLNNANISDYGWIAFYDLLKQSGIKTPEVFDEYEKKYLPAGIYDAIAYDTVIIICDKPTEIHFDDQNRLHNSAGPAVAWEDGYRQYFVHGREMPKEIFEEPITREQFISEKNMDIKGGMYEVLGQEGVMNLLQAKVVDSKSVVHADGSIEQIELLKTDDTFEEIDNQPFAWVKQVCPSTGTIYLAGCEPHHTDAIEAKKSIDGFFVDEEYLYDARA